MNIQHENEITDVKDRELWGKLLGFAKPHWKLIALSFIMAVLIVVANLVQPMIIQVAIDERINGIYQQMIVVQEESAEQATNLLQKQGWDIKSTIHLGDKTYIRLGHLSLAEVKNPPIGEKTQIFFVEGNYYLLTKWVEANQPPTIIKDGEGVQLLFENHAYSATLLSEKEVDIFREQDYTGFIYLGLFFLVAVGSGAALHYFQHNLLQFTGQSIIFDIRQKIFNHLSTMEISFFHRHPVGRLVTRAIHDTEALNQLYSQVIVNLIREALILLGIIAVMFYYSIELTLITFTVIPIIVVLTFYYKKIIRKGQRYVRLILSRLNSYLAENLSGMRIIQLFAREEKQLQQFNELNEEHYRAGMRNTIVNSIFNPAIGFVGNIALAVLVWYGGGQVIAGTVTFGVVYLFTDYARRFFQPLMALADRYNQIQTAMASAERVFELLEEKPMICTPEQPKSIPSNMRGTIQFQKVWFAYEDENWVIKDVSFTVYPGETVAFVGATGAGKSSIINLINRFYDIQKGRICIDGIDVRELDLEELRKRVGIIQQDSFIFTGDVHFNIRLNRKDLTSTDVEMAAQAVQMDGFIRKLPQQYETPLGEQGVSLSAGQKQLISFLRAIVYSPDILILDEATANIDTETEMVVHNALKRLSQGRTTLIVAHRLSTVQHADKIIVLDKGQIREMGNHHQLLKQKGLYHRLYQIQNKGQEKEKVKEPISSVIQQK
jgi:ATP-binding cassette subfamily B multidrug efflux pump